MELRRDIDLFGSSSTISVVCINEKFLAEDTAIAIYDKYKISIMLSNGINAVSGNNIIMGEKYGILFFRPDELHFGRFLESGTYSYLDIFIPASFFDFFVKGNEIINFLTDTSENRINYINFKGDERNKVSNIITKITELLKKENEDIKLFSLILEILILCNDFYDVKKSDPEQQEIPKIVTQTMVYISENYNEELSVKELSEKAKCSVTYLSRTFKKHTGMTIYGYIINTRIMQAQILLKEGRSVTETCFSVGFSDCSNFITKFKRVTGMTPKTYQKNLL